MSYKSQKNRAYPNKNLEQKRKKAIMYLKKRDLWVKDIINKLNGDNNGKDERKILRNTKRSGK